MGTSIFVYLEISWERKNWLSKFHKITRKQQVGHVTRTTKYLVVLAHHDIARSHHIHTILAPSNGSGYVFDDICMTSPTVMNSARTSQNYFDKNWQIYSEYLMGADFKKHANLEKNRNRWKSRKNAFYYDHREWEFVSWWLVAVYCSDSVAVCCSGWEDRCDTFRYRV